MHEIAVTGVVHDFGYGDIDINNVSLADYFRAAIPEVEKNSNGTRMCIASIKMQVNVIDQGALLDKVHVQIGKETTD